MSFQQRIRPSQFLLVREAADRLGRSPAGILAALKRGDIPGGEPLYTDSRGRQRWRIRRAPFERWIALLTIL